MLTRRLPSFGLLTLLTLAVLATAVPAGAETPVESNVDSRVVLAFRVAESQLQMWVPAPWQIAPPASGPSKDANLNATFVQRLLSQNAEGKSHPASLNRVVAFNVPVKNPQTGDAGPMVIRIFATDHGGLPGPYKNSVKASIRREQTHEGANLEPGSATERWLMQSDGGTIEMEVAYQRGVPTRVKAEAKPRSAVEPSFFRLYRIDQGLDVVKSVPEGIDRTQSLRFRSTVAELAPLFDGSEQIVSVTAIPFYVRQVSLP